MYADLDESGAVPDCRQVSEVIKNSDSIEPDKGGASHLESEVPNVDGTSSIKYQLVERGARSTMQDFLNLGFDLAGLAANFSCQSLPSLFLYVTKFANDTMGRF